MTVVRSAFSLLAIFVILAVVSILAIALLGVEPLYGDIRANSPRAIFLDVIADQMPKLPFLEGRFSLEVANSSTPSHGIGAGGKAAKEKIAGYPSYLQAMSFGATISREK